MANIGDVLRLTSIKEFAEQDVINVYFFTVIGQSVIPTDLDAVATALYESERDALASFTSVYLYSGKVVLDNLSNTSQRTEYTPTREAIGTVTGDPLPAHDAIGVRLTRTTVNTRNGSKRYSGLPESIVSSGIVDDTDGIASALRQFLSDDIAVVDSFLSGITLRPVIVGRALDGTYDLGNLNPISNVKVNTYMTTQTSRKQGR